MSVSFCVCVCVRFMFLCVAVYVQLGCSATDFGPCCMNLLVAEDGRRSTASETRLCLKKTRLITRVYLLSDMLEVHWLDLVYMVHI